jgi:tetratricopeptide (TPR) repeat protein
MRRRWTEAALLLGLLALGAAFGVQKIRAFDYWWHLRTGAVILETGAVPKVDSFTYTVPGSRWVDIHWLFQVGLKALHSLGGHDAVVLGKVGFVWLLLGVLATIGWRRERAFVTAFALGMMLLVAGDRFMPRPELLSFVLLASVLALLERHERRPDAWVFAVVPLQVVWVNVHGLFAVGLALCGIYLAAEAVRPLVQPGERLRWDRLRRLALLTLLGGLASLVNPNGLEGALYPVQQLGMIGPVDERGLFGSVIAELLPPIDPAGRTQLGLMVLVGVLAALSFAAMALNWRRLHGAHPLLWVAFAWLGLSARRNLALAAIVFAPILVLNANDLLDRRPLPARARGALAAVVGAALVLLTVDVATGRFWDRIGSLREPGLGVSEIFYPEGAVEWIARERPPGPIAHHMADGGYLLWHLYPDYPVMTDGRLEVFGPERFAELTISSPEHFRTLDEEYHFGIVLIHYSLIPQDRLLRWLRLNTNWRLVFLDETAAVFVRLPPSGLLHLREVDVDAPDLFPQLGEERGVRDRSRRIARTSFYYAMRRYEAALAEWEGLVERYPDWSQGPLLHASLLAHTGKRAAAEAILRGLLADDPESAELLARIGDLRLEQGDLEAAKDLYERALQLAPRLPRAVYQRGRVAEAEGDLQHAALLYTQVVATSQPFDPYALEARRRLSFLGGSTGP